MPNTTDQSPPATPPPGDGFWVSSNALRILVKGAIGLGVVYLVIRVGADPAILGPILRSFKL
ncbi:hypothetical protein GCM10010404_81080 [Nonomuraea africana]|uniref:DUF1206 domain-containing protein n=1 Tax=Nonomuraea africana TaxID=46171 RepID=A0ABR9KWU3_9ACTN|nr:hypothetical protein [Nonomuraea africana]MBE1566514.1 hypothetical protein [Nonomuraea africana]